MIKSKLQTIALALLATVAFSAPVTLKAQDATTTAPAATATPKVKKEKPTPPINGKVVSVDATAKTFKVGEHTFAVTDDTKWEGDLTLATLKEGTKVTVTYTKSGDTYTATDVKAAAAKKAK